MTSARRGSVSGDLVVRRAVTADRAEIVALLAASLGRDKEDSRYDLLFSWKHEGNPFGPSPMWVACDEGRVVGFRALMRWSFERAGRSVRAVRAVDTATHPDYQGRGVFRRLTLHALEELRSEDVGFVFNTPNLRSRPGYLKMGWTVVGRVRTSVHPRSPSALVRLARSRVAAERWSEVVGSGQPVTAAFQNPAELAALLASQPPAAGFRTARTVEYLQWRYGIEPLHYRTFLGASGVRDGVAFVRVRRRGVAREAVLADVLVPGGDSKVKARLVRRVCREVDADYVLSFSRAVADGAGFVRMPRQGPVLVCRAVCDSPRPRLGDWDLSLGDIELF